MSVGFSINDIVLFFVLVIPALVLPYLLLLIGGLIGRLLRIQSDWLPFTFMVLAFVASVLAGSLWLDAAGERVAGVVFKKEEAIEIRPQGDWKQTFTANVRYRLDGSAPTLELVPAAEDGTTGLRLDPVYFDALHEGEAVALKVLPLWRSITLVRLAELSTREMIPWRWLGYAVLIAAVGLMAWRVGRSKLGCLMVLLVGVAGVSGIWAANIFVRWRAAEDLGSRPLRGEATVQEVTRITVIDYFPCDSDCDSDIETEFEAPQEYDIVQMLFTPEGGREPLMVVDSADEGSLPLEYGGKVAVAYAAENPRNVVLVDATHDHHWRNALGFVESMGWQIGLLVAVFTVWGWLGGAWRYMWRWLRRRRSRALEGRTESV